MTDWTLPSELNQPLPRQVQTTGSFKFLLALINVLFLGFGLWMSGGTYTICHKSEVLKTRGVDVQGVIVDTYITTSRSGVHHHADYRFPASLPNGGKAVFQAETGIQNMSLRPGQSVPVIYDPTDPSMSDLNFDDHVRKGDPYAAMPIMLAMIGAMTVLPWAGMMGFLLFGYNKEKSLLQTGRAVAAEIISQEEKSAGRGGRVTVVTYEFTDADGILIDNTRGNLPSAASVAEKEKSRRLMDTITKNPTVLYDPRNSGRNMLYPSTNIRCVLPNPDDRDARR